MPPCRRPTPLRNRALSLFRSLRPRRRLIPSTPQNPPHPPRHRWRRPIRNRPTDPCRHRVRGRPMPLPLLLRIRRRRRRRPSPPPPPPRHLLRSPFRSRRRRPRRPRPVRARTPRDLPTDRARRRRPPQARSRRRVPRRRVPMRGIRAGAGSHRRVRTEPRTIRGSGALLPPWHPHPSLLSPGAPPHRTPRRVGDDHPRGPRPL